MLLRKKKSIDQLVAELTEMLADPSLDPDKIEEIKIQLDDAILYAPAYQQFISNQLLPAHQPSFILKQELSLKDKIYNKKKHLNRVLRIFISVLLIFLGFVLIVIPLPGSMEMVTIYYFTDQDGFTLMDLIALIIVFTGTYTLVTTKRKY